MMIGMILINKSCKIYNDDVCIEQILFDKISLDVIAILFNQIII